MKFLLFCVLAGLSLADEETGIDCKETIEPKGVDECVIDAMDHIDGFFKNLTKIVCHYKDGAIAVADYRDDTCREFISALVCLGCPVEELFGLGKSVEDLIKDEKGACDAIAYDAADILLTLGIGYPVGDLMCALLGHGFAEECAAKLLQGDLSALLTNLKGLICKNTDEMTGKDAADILVAFRCIDKEVLKTDDTLMRKLVEDNKHLFKRAVADVLKTVKEGVLGQGLLADLCSVVGLKTFGLVV